MPHPLTPVLPQTLSGYIWRSSGWHQAVVSVLSITVFLLSAAPLEIQRRIVNDAIQNGAVTTILWLAFAYGAVAFAEGGIKLVLNIYRAWISENSVRQLRHSISALTGHGSPHDRPAAAQGTEISMILSEVEPIGGFVGISVSEPLLQGGVLLSVFGYLFFLDPPMALLSIAAFSPQLIFVPLLQRAINLKAKDRIKTLRDVSGGIAHSSADDGTLVLQDGRIDRVFDLNMGIFKLKFAMNFLMNLVHHLGVATSLAVGGWYALTGRIEVGTVVAFVSGLAKVNDPWGDVVNWFRELTVVGVKYRLITEATDWLVRSRESK